MRRVMYAVRSLFSRKVRLISRGISFLLVTVLLAQVLFIGPIPSVKSKTRLSIPAVPVGAPPEPFILNNNSHSGVSLPVAIAANLISRIPNPFSGDEPGEPFAGPVAASFGEKLRSMAAPFLALANPVSKPLNAASNPARPLAPTAPGNVSFDFDGDNKADIGTWKPSTAQFKVKKSSDGSYITTTLGTSSSIMVPGDYDGNGITDVAVFSAGTWNCPTASPNTTFTLGSAGDIPMVGDYDGDGKTDAAVFTPGTPAVWSIRQSSNSAVVTHYFGTSGDIPTSGDYDGDGFTDIAVYRPSTGTWHLKQSSSGYLAKQWGIAIDIPVQGDFDGDGRSDLAVYRPTEGTWYVATAASEFQDHLAPYVWGSYADQPVAADYNGDGITDYAVWRPTSGVWYLTQSIPAVEVEDIGRIAFQQHHTLGVPGDKAVPAAYTKQVGGTVSGSTLAAARLDPRNATGGTNLYSQNFSWGTSLVGLPGRAGMDAGFGMSYNSLVWTKIGSVMYFDPDTSNISPWISIWFSGYRAGLLRRAKGSLVLHDGEPRWCAHGISPDRCGCKLSNGGFKLYAARQKRAPERGKRSNRRYNYPGHRHGRNTDEL